MSLNDLVNCTDEQRFMFPLGWPGITSSLTIKDSRFPTFPELPYDNDYDDTFYKADQFGVLVPRQHWCFLVEITQRIPWPLRPMYRAKDADGHEMLIAFHTEDRSPHIAAQCKEGDTIAIMYANSHMFADGQSGIRIESDDMVKVLHRDLKFVRSLAEVILASSSSKPSACRACGQPATQRCSRCGIKYCSKKCQVDNWKPKHKEECPVAQSIAHWKSFD